MRLLKVLAVLILAGVIALAGYAYFGDMDPAQTEVRHPVVGNPAPATAPAATPATEPAPAEAGTTDPSAVDAAVEDAMGATDDQPPADGQSLD